MDDLYICMFNARNGKSYSRGWSTGTEETTFQAIVDCLKAVGGSFENVSPEAVAEIIAQAKLGQ